MNKIIPLVNIIAGIAALLLSVFGISFAILSGIAAIFIAFGIVLTIIAFILAVISCAMGFAFVKSKLCIAAGIISAIAMALSIASFIIII